MSGFARLARYSDAVQALASAVDSDPGVSPATREALRLLRAAESNLSPPFSIYKHRSAWRIKAYDARGASLMDSRGTRARFTTFWEASEEMEALEAEHDAGNDVDLSTTD